MMVMFVIVSAIALIAAVGVVTVRETLYSALCLVVNVAMLGVLFLLLDAQFLFVVQLIVYAGAVMVLFVFIIALLSPGRDDRLRMGARAVLGTGTVVVLTATVGWLAGRTLNTSPLPGARFGAYDPLSSLSFLPTVVDTHGSIQTLGDQLFSTYAFPFEVTSLLLLVAAVGAVYLTRRPHGEDA